MPRRRRSTGSGRGGRATLDDLRGEVDRGHLVVASVHREIRRPERPAPGRGGHLVLVVAETDGDLRFRNPSGHTPESRDARLPHADFERFYAGRGVVHRL